MMGSHLSIFKSEAIEALAIKPEGIYVDATLGRGGHSLEIVKQLTSGHLYVFDLDLEAIKESKIRLANYLDKITFCHTNNANIVSVLNTYNIKGVDGILFDLGVSSPQFDTPERGFSYRFNARLDMRMDQSQSLNAYEVVNTYSEEKLKDIFYRYGEERYSNSIVKQIINNRPIETTLELVDVIKKGLPNKVLNSKGHPAKKVFQAIRIEVNKELDSLEKSLNSVVKILNPKGRCVVITFHSLEDRIVKDIFNSVSKAPKMSRRVPLIEEIQLEYKHLTKNVIKVSEEEKETNLRSHSAKLRILEKKE